MRCAISILACWIPCGMVSQPPKNTVPSNRFPASNNWVARLIALKGHLLSQLCVRRNWKLSQNKTGNSNPGAETRKCFLAFDPSSFDIRASSFTFSVHRSSRLIMVRLFNALGAPLLSFFPYLGELVLLAADTFRSIFTHKLRWKLFLNQVVEIGLLSQLVVIITGAFTGAVFAAQTFFQFNKIGMGSAT